MSAFYVIGGVLMGFALSNIHASTSHPGWIAMMLLGIAAIVTAAFVKEPSA